MGYKILVAMDFSKMGKKVTAYGYDVAKRFGGEVTFFHVVPEPNIVFNSYAPAIPVILDSNLEDLKNTAKKKLEYYVSEEKDKNEDIKCNTVVEIGDPAQCIIECEGEFDSFSVVRRVSFANKHNKFPFKKIRKLNLRLSRN